MGQRVRGEGDAVKKGLQGVAIRTTLAQERFLDYVTDRGFTRSEAERIYEVYRKAKAIKIDRIGGQFTFTHGAFGDLETLRLALAQGKK